MRPTTSCQKDVTADASSTTPTVNMPAMTSRVGLRPRFEQSQGATRQPMMIPAEPVPVPADCFSDGML